MDSFVSPLANLLQTIIQESHAENQRRHEEKIEELILAVKLSQVDSLYDLKIIYKAITIFANHMADFQHRERQYSMEHEIRKGILDKLLNYINGGMVLVMVLVYLIPMVIM